MTKTISVVYKWRDGSRVKDIDAGTAARRFEEIRQRHGVLTAEAVVDDARPVDSPLHQAFEWDDAVAAEEYRKEQARHLIRSLVIKTIEEGPAEPVRTYVVVSGEHEGQDGDAYVPVQVAMSDAVLRAQVLEKALRELQQFRKKYAHLKELTEVFVAMDRIIEDVENGELPKPAA